MCISSTFTAQILLLELNSAITSLLILSVLLCRTIILYLPISGLYISAQR
jgi:hypothetical protein